MHLKIIIFILASNQSVTGVELGGLARSYAGTGPENRRSQECLCHEV